MIIRSVRAGAVLLVFGFKSGRTGVGLLFDSWEWRTPSKSTRIIAVAPGGAEDRGGARQGPIHMSTMVDTSDLRGSEQGAANCWRHAHYSLVVIM